MQKLSQQQNKKQGKSFFGCIWQVESNNTILLDLLFKEHIIQTR